MIAQSLDGRVFAAVDPGEGETSRETTFHYTEMADMVSATYSGGRVRRGFLVGVRDGNSLDFRYAQLHVDGTTASGHCQSEIEQLEDGRLRLLEHWSWESRQGSGQSIVEELKGWENEG